MVKPGGTGRPRLAISARLAPLPPSRSRRPALPSALPSPKVNTHLPDFATSAAGLAAAILLTAFGAGLAGPFFSALRAPADGAALVRAGVDDFDFAAVFLFFATALAMIANNPQRGRGCAPYTTFRRFRARRERVMRTLGACPNSRCSILSESDSSL